MYLEKNSPIYYVLYSCTYSKISTHIPWIVLTDSELFGYVLDHESYKRNVHILGLTTNIKS